MNLNDALNFTTNGYITLRVWTEAQIGTPMQIKLEQQSGGSTYELVTNTTTSGEWETLSWDFSALGVSSYDRLVFMFDIGDTGDGSNESTFYFDDVQQTSTLGVVELNNDAIRIYPNPVNSVLYMESNAIDINRVEIYSMLGHKVLEQKIITNSINIETLSDGLYFVKFYSGNGSLTKKLIKK